MRAIGIVGWSGSGKTTLVTALIAQLRQMGLTISTVKHAHHTLRFDTPGKDSFRHAQAGAQEVILASRNGFALFSAAQDEGLDALLARLAPVDIVLVEGFKSYDIPKLEVYRPALGQPPLWREMEMAAVISDAPLPDCPVPVLDIAAVGAVAELICRLAQVGQPDRADL